MGKARPWMLWSYIGNTVCLIAIFAIPSSWGDTAKYAYFFIAYTLLNAVFYTANNIAYASLTALITKTTMNVCRWAPSGSCFPWQPTW